LEEFGDINYRVSISPRTQRVGKCKVWVIAPDLLRFLIYSDLLNVSSHVSKLINVNRKVAFKINFVHFLAKEILNK